MAPKSKAKAGAKGSGKLAPQPGKPASTEETQPPNWPILKPLVPPVDLYLENLLEGQIVLIRKFFTSSLCQQYVSFLSSLPLTTTPGQPKKGDAVRVNDRFQIQDHKFARMLWERTSLESLITESDTEWGGSVCGLNPNVRIYRYKKGQFFDQHYDDTNLVIIPGENDAQDAVLARTTWTLLIYLTGPSTGCVGGETVFYPDESSANAAGRKARAAPEPIAVSPEVGLALLHKHGNDCMLHEGRMVEAGEKWVIRSDLCVTR